MSAKSGRQYRMMQAIANGYSDKKVSKKVAKHFIKETTKVKRSLFASYGK